MAGIPKDVWYAGGLRFQCTQCGDCCSGSEGYVWVNQQEIDAMAKTLTALVDAPVGRSARVGRWAGSTRAAAAVQSSG